MATALALRQAINDRIPTAVTREEPRDIEPALKRTSSPRILPPDAIASRYLRRGLELEDSGGLGHDVPGQLRVLV